MYIDKTIWDKSIWSFFILALNTLLHIVSRSLKIYLITEPMHVVSYDIHARIQEFSSGGGGGGGLQVSLTIKSSDNVFFYIIFWSSTYFTEVKWEFQRNLSFYKVPEGVQHLPGGVQVFPGGGGVKLLIPYRNPYNLWFSRGGPDPLSPLWIRTWYCARNTWADPEGRGGGRGDSPEESQKYRVP